MNYNLTAEQALKLLIEIIETDLDELRNADSKSDFIVGEWYAYIECLELVAHCKKAQEFGLNYDPEVRYKLN